MLIPLCLVVFGGRLSGFLLRPRRRGYDSVSEQAVHVAVGLMAVLFGPLWLLGAGLLGASGHWAHAAVYGAAGVAMLALLVFSWPAARFLRRLVDRLGKPLRSGGAVALGLFLIGALAFATSLRQLAQILISRHGRSTAVLFGYQGVSLVIGLALLLLAGRLGAAASKRRPRADPQPKLSGPRAYYETALFLAAIYLLIIATVRLAWRVDPLGAILLGPALLVVLAGPVLPSARLVVPRLAGRLGSGAAGPSDGGDEGALLYLEAGVTVMALHVMLPGLVNVFLAAIAHLFEGIGARWSSVRTFGVGSPGLESSLVAVFAAGLVLLLRGDLAWLLRARLRERPGGNRAGRAALLYPCLLLLGAWHFTKFLPAVTSAFLPGGRWRPAAMDVLPGRVTGLLLATAMFALAGPLSRLLAYRPLIPRIWWHGWQGQASKKPDEKSDGEQ